MITRASGPSGSTFLMSTTTPNDPLRPASARSLSLSQRLSSSWYRDPPKVRVNPCVVSSILYTDGPFRESSAAIDLLFTGGDLWCKILFVEPSLLQRNIEQ